MNGRKALALGKAIANSTERRAPIHFGSVFNSLGKVKNWRNKNMVGLPPTPETHGRSRSGGFKDHERDHRDVLGTMIMAMTSKNNLLFALHLDNEQDISTQELKYGEIEKVIASKEWWHAAK
jgi:hypothetical protein